MRKILKVGLAILGLSSAVNASMTQEEQAVLDYARSAYSNPAAHLPTILQGFDVIWTGEKI